MPPPTDSPIPPEEPAAACTTSDLDAYLEAVSPALDQLIIAAQEATLLQALAPDRLTAMAETAAHVHDQLSAIQPPECLKDAHLAAVTSAALLIRALDGIASGAYPTAEEDLRNSFEQVAQALAEIGMRYWEQTPTPAPSH
jgi:hypothetical protein